MTTRALMKGILETAGFDVTACVDGEHAWNTLGGGDFDLVVSDVDLPRMNGFELTEKVRRNWPDLPVILVTARATEDDRAQGVRVGANAYFVKSGFDQVSFLELIDQLA